MAKLVVALVSGDNIRDMIEELVKTGKEVEAVYIASEAGLTDVLSPVKLLKTCLSNCQITTSNDAPSREDMKKEVMSTRAIIKCIEDHKLESEFSMSTLKTRVNHLDKLKTNNNKKTDSATNKQWYTRRRFDAATSRLPKMSRVSYGYSNPRVTTEPVYSQNPAQYANQVTRGGGHLSYGAYDYKGKFVLM